VHGFWFNLMVFDKMIFNSINQQMANTTLDFVMPWATRLGNGAIIWLIIMALLYWFGGREGRKAAVLGLVSLIISHLLVDYLIKDLIARPRPFLELSQARVLVTPPTSFSFPSGHSSHGFAVATTWIGLRHRLGIPALILAALIAFSRIYVGVHYPLDVLGGLVVGVAVGAVVLMGNRYRKRPRKPLW